MEDVAPLGSTRSGSIVIAEFTGFFAPVDNAPVVNTANAGSSIPVKFALGGNRGPNIFLPGYPKAVAVTCSAGAPIDTIEEVTTATTSGLQYDSTTQWYTYTWKTAKSFAGRCYELQIRFVDGSTRIALFKFK
ncbi:MAG: PxKF domain-containing protein [Gaiella sp.]